MVVRKRVRILIFLILIICDLQTEGVSMKIELTETQKNILDFLIDQIKGKGIPPTLADIAKYFGYKNRATVQQHLQAIEKKGYIRKNPNLARGIELTLEDKFFVPKPVLGEVAAGNPLTIYPDAIDTVELPTIARMPKDSFLLRVKGDSLKDAYIFSGDIVIVNPNLEPKNGRIVAAILDDAAVVKRFYKKKNEIELVSENPDYAPIVIDKKYSAFKIVGLVIGVYRSMDKKAG
jgi:repressor LexA